RRRTHRRGRCEVPCHCERHHMHHLHPTVVARYDERARGPRCPHKRDPELHGRAHAPGRTHPRPTGARWAVDRTRRHPEQPSMTRNLPEPSSPALRRWLTAIFLLFVLLGNSWGALLTRFPTLRDELDF